MNARLFCILIAGILLVIFAVLRVFHPGLEQRLDHKVLQPERGLSYLVAGKAAWPLKREIIENGRALPEAHTLDEVRTIGDGRYFWIPDAGLYFAPTDNIDPRNKERIFVVRTFIFVRMRYMACVILLLLLSLTARRWSQLLLRFINGILPPSNGKDEILDRLDSDGSSFIESSHKDYGMNWKEFDILVRMKEWWNAVDRRYKTALAIAFPVTLLTFSIFTFHYLLNDHTPSLPDMRTGIGHADGRWFFEIVIAGLTAYANIPILQQVLTIVLQLGAGVIVLRTWGLRSLTSFGAVSTLLLIAVHPNNLTTYFYTQWSPAYSAAAFLAAYGVFLAKHPGIMHILLGGGVFCLSLGTYQASMSVAATVITGYAIMRLFDHSGSVWDLLWRYFRPVWSMTAAFLFGGILYRISLSFLGISSYATQFYSGDIPMFMGLMRRSVIITLASFQALWITQPDFSRLIKLMLLFAFFSSASFLAYNIARHQYHKKVLIAVKLTILCFLLIGLVIATKTLFYIVNANSIFEYRYNLAMPFFTAFCFYVVFTVTVSRRFVFWRSIIAVICCCVIFIFMRSDLLRQGILLAGHRHDLAVANRVLERIESLPGFDFSKRYYIIRLGSYSSERARMMNILRPYDNPGGSHMDPAEVFHPAQFNCLLEILGTRVRFNYLPRGRWVEFWNKAVDLVKKHNAKRWPEHSSIIVDGENIVVNM